jgi:O-antigen ligase
MKKIFNLENIIYCCILGLPLYLVRFCVFGLPANVWEIGAMGVVLIWVRQHLRVGHCLRREEIFGQKYLKPFGIIFLGLLLATLANGNYAEGFGIIKSWLIIPFLFSWATLDVLDKGKSRNILRASYLSVFLVAVVSWGYYFLGYVTYDGRLQAFFNSPNYLFMYLAPGIIIGCGFILSRKSLFGESMFFRVVALLVMLFPAYETFSYAGWVAVATVIFWMLWANGKMRMKYFIILAGLFLGLLFLQKDSNKFRDLIGFRERSSVSSRVMIWRSAGRMLEKDWFLGIGPGNFQKKYLEYQKYYPPYLEWAVPHPHSLYLAFWLYGGILGVGGFLYLAGLFFWEILSNRNGNQGRLIFAGIIFYFFIHGIFDTTYFKNDLAVVFWLAYGGWEANKKIFIY